MKKILMALGLGLISGSLYAACTGPLCYDDTGTSINGVLMDGNGWALPVATKATILASAPKAVGQLVRCSDCVSNLTVCISSSALASPATNQYLVFVSTVNGACH